MPLLNHDLNWIDAHDTRTRHHGSNASLCGSSRLGLVPYIDPSFHTMGAEKPDVFMVDLIIKRALFLRVFGITFAKNGLNGLFASPINCEPILIPIYRTCGFVRKSCHEADILSQNHIRRLGLPGDQWPYFTCPFQCDQSKAAL